MRLVVKSITILGILLLLSLSLYYPIFSADYVWDDTMLFVQNKRLVDEAWSWHTVSAPLLPATSYLRPLVLSSWWLEFYFFGLNPVVSHIIGFVIYFINVILVYVLTILLAFRLNKPAQAVYMAGIASLLYTLHPALIETTAWISGRFDQFVTLFILLSCILFVYGSKSERFSILHSVLLSVTFFAALMSKELGIVLPMILMCLFFAMQGNQPAISRYNQILAAFSQYRYLCVGIVIVLIGYFLLRHHSVAGIYHESLSMAYIQKYWLENLIPLHAYADYIKQSFLPFYSTAAIHPINSYAFSSPAWIMLLAVSLVGLLWVLYQAVVKNSAAAWIAIAGLISIVLVLHFIPLSVNSNLIHERFMTLGVAFWAIALVFIPYHTVLKRFVSHRMTNFVLGGVLVIWCALGLMTIKSIVPMWHSDYTLWYWLNKTYPEDELARYNYLYALGEYRSSEEVIKFLDDYYKGKPMDVRYQIVYANAKLKLNDPESVPYYDGIIIALPKFHQPDPRQTYANFSKNTHFGMALQSFAGAYMGHAMSYLRFKGDLDTAEKSLEIARYYYLEGEQDLLNANLIVVLYLQGKQEKALALYRELISGNEERRVSLTHKRRYTGHINALIQSICQDYADKMNTCKLYHEQNPFQ